MFSLQFQILRCCSYYDLRFLLSGQKSNGTQEEHKSQALLFLRQRQSKMNTKHPANLKFKMQLTNKQINVSFS